jgi:hypothetical protein
LEITPEMAAIVVRDYILPMFESDGKKLLRMRGKSGPGNNKGSKLPGATNEKENNSHKTVFEELKLT